MAKIKLTKSALKQQRDALKRYERYLPTLQLKKQQLQLEVRRVREAANALEQERAAFAAAGEKWLGLLDDHARDHAREHVRVSRLAVALRNIAGIDVPEFVELEFTPSEVDLFTTPFWYDDVAATLRQSIELRLRNRILDEQLSLLEQELRVITQRVNLFEKVKIPEARESIRRIQIYLGDQQTGAVGRAKIAKEKCRERDAVTESAGR